MSTVTNVIGYLEYDYATRPYLQGLIEIADGLQFEAIKLDAREVVGFQFEGKITTAIVAGAQWQARVTASTQAALQFEVFIQGKSASTGVQFQGESSTLGNAALQFESEVTVARNVGFQWQHRRTEAYAAGLQWQSDVTTRSSIGVEQRASSGWIHYQCGPGYLEEFGYLQDWPYLAPRICVSGGMQFEGRSEQTREIGLQFQGKIYETLIPGLQFQGKIYEASPNALQFGAKRIEEQPVGLQAKYRIDVTDAVGLQNQAKIFEVYPAGIQLQAVNIVSVGTQVRAVLYNATNLRIMCEFPSRGTSGTNWTASSTAPSSTSSFSVNNLNTDITEQVWRSTETTSCTLTCDTERTGGVFVDTIAILNHNFSGGATVLVQASDNAISWINYCNMLVETENMYYVAPDLPLTPYRYYRFIITDSRTTPFQVGTILFGSSIIFQGECFVDTVRFGKRQFKDQVFTEGHTNVANDRGKKRFLGLEFTDLNFGLANFRQLRGVFDDAGSILKCLWIPTPQTPSRFAIFGKLEEIPEETHNTRGDDYVSLSVRVDESL